MTSKPPRTTPHPIAFAAIALLGFGSFAYIVTERANDPEKHKREKRIPHPDPLKPVRNPTVS